MGFLDHFTLVMSIFVHSPSTCLKYVEKEKSFSKINIENYKEQLKTELWVEVYLQSDVNSAYCVFLSKFHKYFLHSFLLKMFSRRKGNNLV
jgi:hypothetical protein